MDSVCNEFVTQFDKEFSWLKDRKIVLYGIGYRTEALIVNLGEKYDFIGLMDREESNIGKIYFGYKVLDNKTVIKKADCIIIVSVSFYDVIYNRISWLTTQHGIDIYFSNGVKAEQKQKEFELIDTEYQCLNLKSAKKKIELFDTVTFDLFDTLCMRKVLDSDTIFEIMDYNLRKERIDFFSYRKQAYFMAYKGKTPTLEQIYFCFQSLTGLPTQKVNDIKEMEIETEKKFWVIRRDVAELFHFAQKIGKRVFIITDMYFSSKLLKAFLEDNGIKIENERIIVSCEYQMDKETGELWNWFKRNKGEECGRILHIGDNFQSDIFNAQSYDIQTMHILSAKDIMRHTTYNRMLKQDISLWAKLSLGLIGEKLFNSPFMEGRVDQEGRIILKNKWEVGYIGYGCLIGSFLGYILKCSEKMGIDKLLFCARDGYLLKQDFEEFLKMLGKQSSNIETRYLKISRLLVRRATLFDDKAVADFMNLPYRGSEKDFFYLRAGLELGDDKEIEMPRDKQQVMEKVCQNKDKIKMMSKKLKKDYVSYVDNEIGEIEHAALIDFGYSGATQYYLSKIFKRPLTGIYLLADMDEGNAYNKDQNKFSFFYNEEDPKGAKNLMFKCFLLLESVFTAPCGTYLYCDSDGTFKTGERKQNNILFSVKEKINAGVLDFLLDCGSILGKDLENFDFQDEIGTELLTTIFENQKVIIEKEILDTFYSDDIFRYQTERKIFD